MNGNIFIIGASGIGKTPLAEELAKQLKRKQISASEWVKQLFKPSSENLSREEYIKEITTYSKKRLKEEPFSCINYIEETYPDFFISGNYIIDGIRNPFDFNNLFDPKTDYVVYLNSTLKSPKNRFEAGIILIYHQVNWLEENGIMPYNNSFQKTINTDRFDLETVAFQIKKYFKL
jgi:cytidylate kinase